MFSIILVYTKYIFVHCLFAMDISSAKLSFSKSLAGLSESYFLPVLVLSLIPKMLAGRIKITNFPESNKSGLPQTNIKDKFMLCHSDVPPSQIVISKM